MSPVITVDGPSGSGKGTIAQRIATTLGWHFLDSGALYRILGLAAEQRGISFEDAVKLAELSLNIDIVFKSADAGGDVSVWLDGVDVSSRLRTEAIGSRASQVAALPAVRAALLARQRDFRQPPGLVADGRDMGTVVFADAPLKFFVTASADERAKRRYKQLKQKGIDANLDQILEQINARDKRDLERQAAPLRPADDAIVVDTTGLGIEQVVERVMPAVLAAFA